MLGLATLVLAGVPAVFVDACHFFGRVLVGPPRFLVGDIHKYQRAVLWGEMIIVS